MYQPEKLKARRKELKLTQREIAEQLGISFQAYSAWERGVKEPSKEKVAQLENILKVPKGYFTQIEIVRLYHSLSKQGKEKVVLYARNLSQEEQAQKVAPMPERLYEYRVYERMSAGIGASVYDDQNFDTVYFNEELAHDFASWVSGDSMEPKYQNGSVALIRETGFDYDGAVYAVVCNNQTLSNGSIERRMDCVWSLSILNTRIFSSPMRKILGLLALSLETLCRWRVSLWATLIIPESPKVTLPLSI